MKLLIDRQVAESDIGLPQLSGLLWMARGQALGYASAGDTSWATRKNNQPLQKNNAEAENNASELIGLALLESIQELAKPKAR